jgi:hypothetical protein
LPLFGDNGARACLVLVSTDCGSFTREGHGTIIVEFRFYSLQQRPSFSLVTPERTIVDINPFWCGQRRIEGVESLLEHCKTVLEPKENSRMQVIEPSQDEEVIVRGNVGDKSRISDELPIDVDSACWRFTKAYAREYRTHQGLLSSSSWVGGCGVAAGTDGLFMFDVSRSDLAWTNAMSRQRHAVICISSRLFTVSGSMPCIQPWPFRCGFDGLTALLCFIDALVTNHLEEAGTPICRPAHSAWWRGSQYG